MHLKIIKLFLNTKEKVSIRMTVQKTLKKFNVFARFATSRNGKPEQTVVFSELMYFTFRWLVMSTDIKSHIYKST